MNLEPLTPAVMYEREAAKYLKVSIHDFRRLVLAGLIPYRRHPGRKRRIYLKCDLDAYLSSLPEGQEVKWQKRRFAGL